MDQQWRWKAAGQVKRENAEALCEENIYLCAESHAHTTHIQSC